MPSLTLIKPLGWGVFMSKGHKLPTKADWKQPQGNPDAEQYRDGVGLLNWVAIPQGVPFFTPQNPQKYHQDSCNKIGKEYKDFHDKMLDAIKFAHDMWRLQAKFDGLKIMAVCAIGTPGCLKGPELESSIKTAPSVAAWTGNMAKWRDAVAKGVSQCFKKWQDKVMVPGLPWYPAFAAFPGPQAPPMPNVPMPLITCPSAMMAEMTVPSKLRDAMVNALDSGCKDKDHDKHYKSLFEAIGTVVSLGFTIWLVSQQINLVLGQGPIPTFAPPFVPVGPVVNGSNIAVPGHLIT
ncbi:MAG: hypothetical protein RBU37_08420 [Myxococcota bacterium]|jgi:hypothetical protein|nr:hypothetical protein [Myxococcota bacterium]